MPHILLKYVHVVCVVISGSGFFLRGLWMAMDSSLLLQRWVRIGPHVVDTALLASAVGLVIVTGQYPWSETWVLAKIVGLTAYIALGTMALRRGRTKAIRLAHWVAALLVFGYIVSVALTRDPLGVLRLL